MAENTKSQRLSAEECLAKAAECRAMAKRAASDAHRIMLDHMAETWERIVANLAKER